MKKFWLYIFVLLLISLSSGCIESITLNEEEQKFVGKWIQNEVSFFNQSLYFYNNHEMAFITNGMNAPQNRWRVENNKLIIGYEDATNKVDHFYIDYIFSNNTLTLLNFGGMNVKSEWVRDN